MAITLAPGQTEIVVEKDKDARKDLRFEFAEIMPPGDTLASVTWSAPPGVTVSDTASDNTDAVAWISGGTPLNWYSCLATWVSAPSGATDQFVVRIYIKEDAETNTAFGSALFPNKFTAVAQMRRDSLILAAQSHFAGVELSGEYIWGKLLAAEAEVARTLRVKLTPTAFFPVTPTQEQIDALNGMPWDVDHAYDYDPEMFQGNRWGFIDVRNSPLISVQSLRYSFPSSDQFNFEVPIEWLRLDKKYGNLQIVPSSVASIVMSGFLLQLIGSGRVIPQVLAITYVAGLENAARDYPDLVDVVKKVAVLKIIEDAFLPQSGSISADGLSQSMSVDMSKYDEAIDRILNGRKGSNGGLRTAIHGITLGVM
jgi:hypothetical protein